MTLNTVTEKSISYSQPSFAAIHRWSKRHNDGGDSSEDQSEKIIARIFSLVGIPHQSPFLAVVVSY
jgi:hypothetical protein